MQKKFIGLAWNTVVMSEQLLLITTLMRWISYKNEHAVQLLVLLFLFLFLFLFPYFCSGWCSSELVETFPYSFGRSTCYSDRLHNFYVKISRCYYVFLHSLFTGRAGSGIVCLQNFFFWSYDRILEI